MWTDVRDHGFPIGTFKLNQKIYRVRDETHRFRFHKKCDVCGTTGKVMIYGRYFQCPQCHGASEIIEVIERKVEDLPYKIKSVNTFVNDKIGREMYTDDSTGMGVLIYHDVKNPLRWYATKEEAQAACDQYNQENHIAILLEEYTKRKLREEAND